MVVLRPRCYRTCHRITLPPPLPLLVATNHAGGALSKLKGKTFLPFCCSLKHALARALALVAILREDLAAQVAE
jgi:hypothetical protein